jgi:hypothetical protein
MKRLNPASKRAGFFQTLRLFFALVLPGLFFVPAAEAQSLKGMTANGATGLFTLPSGRINWEEAADIGLDVGLNYDFVGKDPLVQMGLSLFKWAEITAGADFQPYVHTPGDATDRFNNTDTILGAKLRFPIKRTALALGGNAQFLLHDSYGTAGQLYAALTYQGSFFDWPVETSFALGYTFHQDPDSNLNFGLGFDIELFPDLLRHLVHWITDYSNFSYSVEALGPDPFYRGDLSTGIRLDFSAIPLLDDFKLSLDITAVDLMDKDSRSGRVGFLFGVPLLRRFYERGDKDSL